MGHGSGVFLPDLNVNGGHLHILRRSGFEGNGWVWTLDLEFVLAKGFPTKFGCLLHCFRMIPPRKRPWSTFRHSMRYRMHTSISHFPSKHFYNDRLENVENLILLDAAKSVFPRPNQRVVWIDCDSPHQLGRVIQVGTSSRLLSHLARWFLFLCDNFTQLDFPLVLPGVGVALATETFKEASMRRSWKTIHRWRTRVKQMSLWKYLGCWTNDAASELKVFIVFLSALIALLLSECSCRIHCLAWKAYKRLLAERCCTARDVAIITPYKAQQQYIERKLALIPFLYSIFGPHQDIGKESQIIYLQADSYPIAWHPFLFFT